VYKTFWECLRCGYKWHETTEQITDAVNKIREEGCLKCRGTFIGGTNNDTFKIDLVGHEVVNNP